jgi:GNAT superfamily N-acetyltransferase
MMEEESGGYRINDQREKTDLHFVQRELAASYWSKNIPMEIVRKAADNSICFNVFSGDAQVAFARVITDKATFAYLCDVIVTGPHRGRGIGKALMAFIMKHPDLQGLRRFTLATRDAHGLYSRFGFAVSETPQNLMEIRIADIYG